ncbi:MAG: hypothetical protein RIG61_01430 [Deltaproteobacteria bacterium]
MNKKKLKLYIYPEITKDEFLLRIRNDPFCIYNDPLIKRAIHVLHHCCLLYDKREMAKNIFKSAGLNAFIPEYAKGRKSSDKNLARVKSRKLYTEIETYKFKLASFLNKRYTRENQLQKRKDIQEAFKSIFGYEPSTENLNFLTHGEHDKDKVAIAIGLYCLNNNFKDKYESVKKRYYKISKTKETIFKREAPRILKDRAWLRYLIKNKINPSQYLVRN